MREADDSEGHTTYRIGERKELFIMLKVGDGTAGEQTDAGWVYAIATAHGSKVTHAGRIESCMRCHEDAGPSRLFGPKRYAPGEKKPTIVGAPPS